MYTDYWTPWFEIPVGNLFRAKHFYETIFEMEIIVNDFGNFKMGLFPLRHISGALVEGEDYAPSRDGVLVYLNANPDLSIIQDRIVTAGGELLIPKRMISPEHGHMALFIDSEGNRLALHSDQ